MAKQNTATQSKPNILVIWGDDIGIWNLAGNRQEFLKTFKAFPPRQKAASFTIDQAMEKMAAAGGSGGR
jgi:arylsulfatase A-like enzyme